MATDCDGTLAHDGRIDPQTVAALERLNAAGCGLKQVFEIIDKRAQGKTDHAIEGIFAEGDEVLEVYKDTYMGPTASARAVEDDEITRDRTLKRWPPLIRYGEVAPLLDLTLQGQLETDESLTARADASACAKAQSATR